MLRPSSEPEPQILDYQTQQYKLIPQLATVFAVFFSAKTLWDTYNEVTGSIQEGNLNQLPRVNGVLELSGMKYTNAAILHF